MQKLLFISGHEKYISGHEKTSEKNVQDMMKYWFGTTNIYVWTIQNPFLITKTNENNTNKSNSQFLAMKKHVSSHNSARFCPLGLRFCMHLGPSKIKILTKYGALGPLNKGLNEEINFQTKTKF